MAANASSRGVNFVVGGFFCLVGVSLVAAWVDGRPLPLLIYGGIAMMAAVGWVQHRLEVRRVRTVVEGFELADIASARGQVAVEGRVIAKRYIQSKLGRTNCVAYRCRVWWQDAGRGDAEGRHLLVDTARAVPFLLRDESGCALVHTRRAHLVASCSLPSAVPSELIPRVKRLVRRHCGRGAGPPRDAASVFQAGFDNWDARLLFEEDCVVDGALAVVLGQTRAVPSARCAELGIPMSSRSAPRGVLIRQAPANDGV